LHHAVTIALLFHLRGLERSRKVAEGLPVPRELELHDTSDIRVSALTVLTCGEPRLAVLSRGEPRLTVLSRGEPRLTVLSRGEPKAHRAYLR